MIGLDFDRHYVRVVELKESADATALTKFGVARVVQKEAAETIAGSISRTIRELFAEQKIDDKEVHASISGPRIQVRRIALPPMPKEELSEAIKWEAKSFVPFPIENAAIDYYTLKPKELKGGKQEFIVVVADGEAQKKHLEIIKGAGLKCAGLTPVCFALWELAKFHPEFSNQELKALVNIGSESTCLNLFKDHDLLFTREIEFSGESVIEALSAALGLEHDETEKLLIEYGVPQEEETVPAEEEADRTEQIRQVMFSVFGKLQNEIVSSLEYFREQFFEEKIEHIFLAGETARLKNLKEYLVANFGIPVDVVDPLRNIKPDLKLDEGELKKSAQHLAVPVGLALGRSREINLLKVKARKKEKGTEALKFLDYVQIPSSAIVGTLILFLILIFGLNFYLSYSISQIKGDLDTKSIKLSKLVKLRDRKAAFEDITKKDVDVKLLLARVYSLIPKGLTLSRLDFDNAKKVVSIGGESGDPKMASAFLKKVQEFPHFTGAQLIEIKKVGAATTFKLIFNLR